ncbi:MAG: cryptochrome/photolyase family protein, partial [Myxococcota bacterium]
MPPSPGVEPESALFVILGNQLFPFAHVKPYRGCSFFMAEDVGLCTYVRHHKQKIALFLAAMRAHRDTLIDQGCNVDYTPLSPKADLTYEEKLAQFLKKKGKGLTQLVTFEVEDRFFDARLTAFAKEQGLERIVLPSPMFVTPGPEIDTWLDENRPFQASFYSWQRKRLGLLLDNEGKPEGGKWSFDDENRKALPADEALPTLRRPKPDGHLRDVVPLVRERFAEHPGDLALEDWWMPTTRRQATAWLSRFLEERFVRFGPYEDALSTRDPFLFHSVLTPMLNLGLLTPDEVVEKAVAVRDKYDVPLNSLEGFIRQVVGWREFIRGIDRKYGARQEEANFFGHERKLTDHWYEGTTGIVPLDDVIKKAWRYGYTHHIERLMVVGNLMLLCEIEPREAYRWFME